MSLRAPSVPFLGGPVVSDPSAVATPYAFIGIPFGPPYERGMEPVMEALVAPGRWVVTIDFDGLDPTMAPGVGWPEPGGLTYAQVAAPVRALSREGRVAALVITELQPALDVRGATAQVAARLFMNVIGLQRTPRSPRPAA